MHDFRLQSVAETALPAAFRESRQKADHVVAVAVWQLAEAESHSKCRQPYIEVEDTRFRSEMPHQRPMTALLLRLAWHCISSDAAWVSELCLAKIVLLRNVAIFYAFFIFCVKALPEPHLLSCDIPLESNGSHVSSVKLPVQRI